MAAMSESRTKQAERRRSTSIGLRALCVLVTLLLAGSALGQVAHFLLIPHAICAEHGEFLELASSDARAVSAASTSDVDRTQLTRTDADAAHEHCQFVARREREQLVTGAPALEISPAPPRALVLVTAPAAPPGQSISRWLVAPKTSPPSA
jgi:hypothetical protein